jgi:hypothetical protein
MSLIEVGFGDKGMCGEDGVVSSDTSTRLTREYEISSEYNISWWVMRTVS